MCCMTERCCCLGFKYLFKRWNNCTNSFLLVWIHPTQCHLLRSPCQAPIIHLSRQITRTTAETMESSWFYWFELSCQRYWVFIYSNSRLVIRLPVTSTWNICEPRGTWGRSRRLRASWKQQPKSPCTLPQKQSTHGTYVIHSFLASLGKLRLCPGAFHLRAGGEESRLEEEVMTTPDMDIFPPIVQEHFVLCARDKERLTLF